jgi:HEPN domain-containing protein
MRNTTRQWVRKAESDLRVARNEAAQDNPEKDAVGFHCQQAAEKYLKALLCELGLPIPRIHELHELLVLLLPHHCDLSPLKRILVSLSRYAVEYRYPGRSASTRDMRAALAHAERVRLQVRTILGLPP